MICFKPKNSNINLDLNLDMKLYYCGTGDCENNFSWGPGIKDHYKLHYIHDGHGLFRLGDTTYSVSKGQGFLISPNVIAAYKPADGDSWNYSWVAFNGLHAENYLTRANLSASSPLFRCSDETRINQCFQELFDSTKYERAMDLRSLSAFYDLMAAIIEENSAAPVSQSATKPQDLYVKEAIEFIDTNYSRKITIQEIANYVGIDRKYLSKLFSETLNVSPQAYLVNFRLKKACDLLTSSSLSIHEISNSIGYSDPFLFSSVFKKYHTLSPKAYRENKLH